MANNTTPLVNTIILPAEDNAAKEKYNEVLRIADTSVLCLITATEALVRDADSTTLHTPFSRKVIWIQNRNTLRDFLKPQLTLAPGKSYDDVAGFSLSPGLKKVSDIIYNGEQIDFVRIKLAFGRAEKNP